MILLTSAGCASLGGDSDIQRGPESAVVAPAGYTAEIHAAYWTAAAALEKLGYAVKNRVRRVDIQTDNLIKGPTGKWGFASSASPTGVAGGTASPSAICLAAPAGKIYPGVAAHEWAHAILYANGVHDVGLHHDIMRKAGFP